MDSNSDSSSDELENENELSTLKKIEFKLKTIEKNIEKVVSIIKKIKSFKITEKEFIKKYKLNIPLKTETKFKRFNHNLKLKEEFRNDFVSINMI